MSETAQAEQDLGAVPKLSLVIPAFNEEQRLPDLLGALSGEGATVVREAGFELVESVIVDDGSADTTPEILRAASAGDRKIQAVLAASTNLGKGAAVAAGVCAARGEYVLLADVDLSTPLGELGKLRAAIDAGADLAIGSRAVEGAVVERGPAHRKLTGKGFNGAVRLLTGLRIHDTQNGFKLMKTEIAQALLADQICPGFAFDVELLMRADRAGLRIDEVPVVYVHDSRSRVRVASASLKMLRDVCRLAVALRLGGGRRAAIGSGGLPADNPD